MKDAKQLWIDEIQSEIDAYQIKVDRAEHEVNIWKAQIQRRKRIIQRIIECGLPEKRAELWKE